MQSNALRPLLASAILAATAGDARANLLANAGFETTAFTASSNVLADFAGYQGSWGILAGGITPATMGVVPASGAKMLCMVKVSAPFTSTFQAVDVSSYAALIDAGGATLHASARFNTNGGYNGAAGLVRAQFFGGPSTASLIGSAAVGNLALDASPGTWELAQVSSLIPAGTTWIVYEVAYLGSSIGTNTGFVDHAFMDIVPVPAPGALALLGLACAVGRRRR